MEFTTDPYGRPAYHIDDPRRLQYGTPRKETMLILARNTPPGCFVELGVAHGGSAVRLAQLASEQGREIHLFDTFTGMPESTEGIDPIPVGAFSDVSLDKVRTLIPTAIFHAGIFPQTMPDTFEPIAFAHVDCDQFATTHHAIDRFLEFMVSGGIMLFDDYNVVEGSHKAVRNVFGKDIELTREGKAYYVV